MDTVTNVIDTRKQQSQASASYLSGHSLAKQKSIYRPLHTELKEVRVLVLTPGHRNDEIHCRIVYWPLMWARHHSYETVSYCWGDEYDHLNVEGTRLSVPLSAKQALYQFRLPDRDRYLWIDCICLDQSDDGEKSYQIARMHHTYKNGARNLVWLGEDHGTAEDAIRTLALLRNEFEIEAVRREGVNKLSSKIHAGAISDSETVEFNLGPVAQFMSRPLFHRLWIIQEISISRENIVYCGSFTVSMVTIHRAASWLIYQRRFYSRRLKQEHFDSINQGRFLSRYADPDLNKYSNMTTPRQIWRGLLTDQWKYRAKDPRDRIYGLLGLYQHYVGTSDLPSALQPDYTLSLVEIYRNATRYAIETSGGLGVWDYIRRHCIKSHGNKWPSWLPCWHHPGDREIDAHRFSQLSEADGRRKIYASIGVDQYPDALLLQGFHVDSLHGSQVSQTSKMYAGRNSCEGIASFLDAVFASTEVDPDQEDDNVRLMIAETLIAGETTSHRPATIDDCRGLTHLIHYLKENERCPPLPTEVLEHHSDDIKQASYFWKALLDACKRRRFFITKSGRMGLGPQSMEVDDIVVVLWGGKCPFVLRPLEEKGTYELVGVCYMHGIMRGEAARKHLAEGRPDGRFVIL